MCGRTTLTIPPEDLERTFGYRVPADYRPRYNVAPTQAQLALVEERGARGFRTLRWGLVPFWADDVAIGNRMINARSETVMEKSAFRWAFAKRRCLVVVDGFYEWRAAERRKRPYRIRLASGAPFTLAGVWERWDRGETPIESCAILTTGANAVMAPIHDRMPVIVGAEDRERWLSGEASAEDVRPILRPYEGDDLDVYAVSTLVNSPENDLPECVDPVDEPLALF